MPTFNTGSKDWDQGLGTLGQALFPDPSKQAQAYYYGAESRKAQLGSNKMIDEQNWKNRFMQMQPGLGLPTPAAPTWSQPPLENSPPIVNSPGNLPMGGPGPGPVASPGSGPGPGPTLGATVMPSPGASPHTNNPANNYIPQTMSPQEAARLLPAIVAPHTTGTPPPSSPPAPSSPPSPNTTGSDGSVPANDPVSGVLAPGSVTEPDGGRKMSGPAQANGAPAKTPFDLQTYVAIA